MKSSKVVTSMVELLAVPWAKYMMYIMGRTSRFNWTGYFVHTFGTVICWSFGMLSKVFNESQAVNWFNLVLLLGLGLPIILFSLRKCKKLKK